MWSWEDRSWHDLFYVKSMLNDSFCLHAFKLGPRSEDHLQFQVFRPSHSIWSQLRVLETSFMIFILWLSHYLRSLKPEACQTSRHAWLSSRRPWRLNRLLITRFACNSISQSECTKLWKAQYLIRPLVQYLFFTNSLAMSNPPSMNCQGVSNPNRSSRSRIPVSNVLNYKDWRIMNTGRG